MCDLGLAAIETEMNTHLLDSKGLIDSAALTEWSTNLHCLDGLTSSSRHRRKVFFASIDDMARDLKLKKCGAYDVIIKKSFLHIEDKRPTLRTTQSCPDLSVMEESTDNWSTEDLISATSDVEVESNSDHWLDYVVRAEIEEASSSNASSWDS